MNGRVYDYNLGRFLSVDPFIQDPGNSQSMNPYSYIMNNPLSGTDPSGYESCKVEANCNKPKEKKRNRARDGLKSNIPMSNGAVKGVAVQTVSGSIADVNQEVSQLESQGYSLESGQNNIDGSSNAVLTKSGRFSITGGTNQNQRQTRDIEDELDGSPSKKTADGWTLIWSIDETSKYKLDAIGKFEDTFYVGLIDEITKSAQNLKDGKIDPWEMNDNFFIQGINNNAFRKYTMTSDITEHYTQISGKLNLSLRNVGTNETRFLRSKSTSRKENIFRSAEIKSVAFMGFVGIADIPRGTKIHTHYDLEGFINGIGKRNFVINEE
ncbi:MAG: hypothetical protein ACI9IA_001402 [Enterobacterales bacterium]|jgi:hypothetical protein